MERRKTLKEIAQEKGKSLFIESFSVTISPTNIEIPSEGQIPLVESFQGEKFKSVAIVRNVPVTRFVENLNGRVYSKQLWENVHKAKVAEGTLCLADHPGDDSDGSVKDIVGVWRNFKINESNCTADLYLVGKHGQHFLEVLQAGGKNGLSTVGFGELMEDEKTVNPRTYELIRLSDWVLTPSQGVYAEQDNIDHQSLTESFTQKKEINTNLKEEKRTHIMKDPVQALTVRNNIKHALRESKIAKEQKGAALVEAKREIEDVLKYIPEEFQSERDNLKEEIISLDSMIKSEMKEKAEALKTTENSLSDLKESAKTSEIMNTKFKEQLANSKEVIKTLSENEKVIRNDIKTLQEDRKVMLSDISALKEDHTLMNSDIASLISERGQLLSDIKESLDDKIKMVSDLISLKKENKALKAKISKMNEDEIGVPEALEIDVVEDMAYQGEDYGTAIDPMLAYRSDDIDGGIPFENYDDQQGFIENKKPKKGQIKESVTPKRVNRDVLDFYNERVQKTPILKKIKEGILSKPTLVQASRYVENFLKQEDEKPMKVMESFKMRPGFYDFVGDREI